MAAIESRACVSCLDFQWPSSNGIQIQDTVIRITIPIVVNPDVARNAIEVSIPHSPGYRYAVADIATLGQGLVQRDP